MTVAKCGFSVAKPNDVLTKDRKRFECRRMLHSPDSSDKPRLVHPLGTVVGFPIAPIGGRDAAFPAAAHMGHNVPA